MDYGGKNSWTIHLESMERLERKLEKDGQIEHAIKIKNIGDDLRLRALRSLEIDEYLFKWMTTRVSHLLLRDLLVICNFYKLPVSFSREIYNLDLSGDFLSLGKCLNFVNLVRLIFVGKNM